MNQQTAISYQPARIPSARRSRLLLALLLLASTTLSGLWPEPSALAQTMTPTYVTRARSAIAVVGSAETTLFNAPNGAVLQTLSPGDRLTINGRSEDSQWVAATAAEGSTGWVQAQQVILFGLAELPVLPLPDAATAPANLAPTTLPADPLTQTVRMDTTLALPAAVVNSAAVTVTPPALVMATVTVTESKLNVRSGPATTYPVIGKASNGQIYIAQARQPMNDWIQVRITESQLGWVSSQFVALSADVTVLPVAAQIHADNAQPVAKQPIITATPSTNAATGLTGKLVISTGNGGLFYLYNLASGELRPLTHGQDPALSPDGTKIAFTRSAGENGLYVVNSDGSGEQKIFGEQNQLRSPKWSLDSQWLVFSRAAGEWTCYNVGRDCASRQALLSQLPPAVAKDPAAVAQFLDQFDEVENPNWSLARVNASGGDYRDLPALDSARTPDWSTGGIVYQSTAGIQKTADTANPENQVVVAGHHLQDPDWRPDGGRILYQAKRGDHWEIFSVNPDGTDNVALTRPVTTLVDQLPSNVAPAWSPDGQSIVYLSNRGENHSAGAWRLWVMNADGSNQRPLALDIGLVYNNGEQMVSWGL